MLKLFGRLFRALKQAYYGIPSCPVYSLRVPNSLELRKACNMPIESLELHDCVMLITRFAEHQATISEQGKDPTFDFNVDIGSVVGHSSDFDGTNIPEYYIISWANPSRPYEPILAKAEPQDLIAVCKPYSVLRGKVNHLNRMFTAYYESWLKTMDPEDGVEQ